MTTKISQILQLASEKNKLRTTLWVISVLFFFIITLIITVLTPMLADDYSYAMRYIFGTSQVVSGVGDAFRSAAECYMGNSGRFLTHLLYQFFFACDKMVFNIAAAGAAVITGFLLYKLICPGKKSSLTAYILVNLSLWLFSPEYGQDIFWESGAINYLFPMIPILGMLYLYRRHSCGAPEKDSLLRCVLVFLLGVIAGWQFENSSIVVPAVTLLYIIIDKRSGKLARWQIFGFAGSAAGYLLLVAAPGNFSRMDAETASVSLSVPFKFAIISYYWVMFVGFLTAAFIAEIIICIRRGKKKLLIQGAVFAIAALASAYCMIMAPTSPERTWFITAAMMTAAVGIPAAGLLNSHGRNAYSVPASVKAALCCASLLYLLVAGADTAISSWELSQQFAQREQIISEAKENGQTTAVIPVYSHKYPFKSNHDAYYGLYDIEAGADSPNSFNHIAAEYYGLDSIIGEIQE